MEQLNETSRTYSYPNITKVGEDLILTTKNFFIILRTEDIDNIINNVIKDNKTIEIHNGKIIIYKKDGYIILEQINEKEMNRILMVNIKQLVS